MKRIIFILSCLFVYLFLSASINAGYNVNIKDFEEEIVLDFHLNDYSLHNHDINGEEYQSIFLAGSAYNCRKGDPELPTVVTSLAIKPKGVIKLEVISTETRVEEANILPSKGIIKRNEDPNTIPYYFSEIYSQPNFFPEECVRLDRPYIIRNQRGINVVFDPVSFNPEQKKIKVFTHIKVKIRYSKQKGINEIEIPKQEQSDFFSDIYSQKFGNYSTEKYEALNDFGRMLIVVPDEFAEYIEPYILWKAQNGIMVDTYILEQNNISPGLIKNHISDYYNNHPDLAFVQLVGDAEFVPTYYYSGGGADPYYARLVGDDYYPDIVVGRFSAETPQHIITQIEKCIYYERDLSEGEWLEYATGIASSEGAGIGHNGESDFEHIGYIREDLLDYGYQGVDELYQYLGVTDESVAEVVNEGRSLINYCGHGLTDSWYTSGFNIYDVEDLQNHNKMPVINSVACFNGNFAGTTCFAEAWLRAFDEENGESIGAVGMLASSIAQSWAPPMSGQDEAIDLLVAESTKTLGALWFNGICKTLDDYNAVDVASTWNIFGDSSMQVRTSIPQQITAEYDHMVAPEANSFTVNTNLEVGRVTLSDGEWIIATVCENTNGIFNLDFEDELEIDKHYMLTITSDNAITYQDSILCTEVSNGDQQIAKRSNFHVFPNPFKSNTTISLNLKQPGKVIINIYNLRGRKISTTTNYYQSRGKYNLEWQNIFSSKLDIPSGIYFCNMKTAKGTITKKIVLLK